MRAEAAALELRLVKWIVGTGVAGAGLVIAAPRQLGRGGPRTGSAVDRPRDTHEIARSQTGADQGPSSTRRPLPAR